MAAACILGLWAPWERYLGMHGATLAWLYLPGLLIRQFRFPFSFATAAVTIMIVGLAAAGAVLKVAATASAIYLDDASLSRNHLLVGIFHRRSASILGTMLVALGIAILMPPGGAVFFLVFVCLVQLFTYYRAKKNTVVFFPEQKSQTILPARPPTAAALPRWTAAVFSQSFAILYAICLVMFAWRYNPTLLLRCLLICAGVSLVVQALLPSSAQQKIPNEGCEISSQN